MPRARSVALALLALLPSGPLHSQSDTLWRRAMPREVIAMRLDARGNLLVVTDEGITALHADSGGRLWRYGTGKSIPVFRHVSAERLMVGSGGTLAVLDLSTGAPVWRRTDLPDLEKAWVATQPGDSLALLQTRSGFAALSLETGRTAWDSTTLPPGTVVREFFRLRELGLLLLIAKSPENPITLMGVSLDSGTVRWTDPAMFRSGIRFKRVGAVEYAVVHSPVALPDSTMVLYFSTEGPIRVDPRTGAVLWRSDALAGRPVPTVNDGYPRSRTTDSLLLVPSEKRLVALDLATGTPRWATKGEFPNRLNWLGVADAGIGVGSFGAGEAFVTFLGMDGVRRRPTEWRIASSATGLRMGDTLFLANEDQLYAIPFATGIERKVATIGFRGDERPRDIDSLDSGLILMGRQNMVRIERDGAIVYRRYFPAPRPSFWEEFAAATNWQEAPRHAWSATTEEYHYIFTAKADTAGQKGFSLVALDRRDGKELGRMWFDERNPQWLLEPVSGTVFELEGKKEIIARRFVGLRASVGQ